MREIKTYDDLMQLRASEYRDALMSMRLTEADREMLRVFWSSHRHEDTAENLALVMGWKNYNAWNMKFGQFCGRLAKALGVWTGNKQTASELDWHIYVACFCETHDVEAKGHLLLTMRPALVRAVEMLGIVD